MLLKIEENSRSTVKNSTNFIFSNISKFMFYVMSILLHQTELPTTTLVDVTETQMYLSLFSLSEAFAG